MRGRIISKLFKALIFVSVVFVLIMTLASEVEAASGSTNSYQLSTELSVSPNIVVFDAPATVSFTVKNAGASMNSGTMTVSLYCDTPMYLTVMGDLAPVYQYPGIPVDLRSGYKIKKENIPVSSTLSLPNACTYSGKGLAYYPIVVVEHAGYAAYSSTTVKTNPVATPSPAPADSPTASTMTDYKLRLLHTQPSSADIVPYTDTLEAMIMVPSTAGSSSLIPFYSSGRNFNYTLCCDKNSIGSCNSPNVSAYQNGSPYYFRNSCTYTRSGTYVREARVDNQTNLTTPEGYKFATDKIILTDLVTKLSADLVANPAKPTTSQDVTLTALANTNNITDTINYTIWWHCASAATSYAGAKADCGDPVAFPQLGAKYDNLSASNISRSFQHRYQYPGKYYRPKVIIEQGNATSEKSIDLKVDNEPVLIPGLQAISTNTIVNGKERSYNLMASNTGNKISPIQNYNIWWNCSKGLDSYLDTLTSCGSSATDYKRVTGILDNPYTVAHSYLPGTYKPKVVVQRDNLEKAAYVDLVVPPITPSPSPSPSPQKSPSTTPKPSPSPSKPPSPSPTPSPSKTPGQMKITLSTSPAVRYEGKELSVVANVSDTDPSLATTNFSFWWNCNSSSTSVAKVIAECGQPRVMDDPRYTDQQNLTGSQFLNIYGGSAVSRALATEKTVAKTFPSGSRVIKLIVERRGVALETRNAITVLPNILNVAFNISPALASVGEKIELNATSDSNEKDNKYSYYFWWDCNDTTTSLSVATSKCGSPSDSSKGTQYLNQSADSLSQGAITSYSTGGTKKPKVLVIHGNLSTSRVGEIEIKKPTLSAGLLVNPTNVDGEAKQAAITASAGGNATGSANYTFWWNCNSDTTSIEEASKASVCGDPRNSTIGYKADSINSNTYSTKHDYMTPGTFHPKVIVERGGALPAEARAEIKVNEIPEKTLYLDISAQRVGDSFPVNIAFKTTISGTASGQTNYKFWWDCQPTKLDKPTAESQCGDPSNASVGAVVSSADKELSKVLNHTYSLGGKRHPVVLAERSGVFDIKTAEIEIPNPPAKSPTPTPKPSPTPTPKPSPTPTPKLSPTPTPKPSPSPSPKPSPSPSPIPSPSPSPTPTPVFNGNLNLKAGYTVVSFPATVSSEPFSAKGITVFELNQEANTWNVRSPGSAFTLQPNKAYYVYSPQDKTVVVSPPGQLSGDIVLTSGWNFVWSEQSNNLNSYKVQINSGNTCLVKDIPINLLKQDGIIYRWIFIVKDDKALTACKAFSLLTGQDKPSTSCSDSHLLLDEVSSISQKKGVWIYLWPGKIDTWSKKSSWSCSK